MTCPPLQSPSARLKGICCKTSRILKWLIITIILCSMHTQLLHPFLSPLPSHPSSAYYIPSFLPIAIMYIHTEGLWVLHALYSICVSMWMCMCVGVGVFKALDVGWFGGLAAFFKRAKRLSQITLCAPPYAYRLAPRVSIGPCYVSKLGYIIIILKFSIVLDLKV